MAFFINNHPDLSGSTFNPSSLMAISNHGLLCIEPQKQRTCHHCRTTRTPLWRAGPAGPRSLCNACGIRYRKLKNSNGGVNKSGNGKKVVRVVDLGREIMLHRATAAMAENGGAETIGEEEQAAAMLLMALSSGYVS
ncbi:GATA transcription factor 15-like [Cucurbita pepo subsp. pepo]|uniref:GATA transcription factor 15-like n=1 Tax=Cucurbita pepo subsp. pepo TaxID=3664 RepID=UPI000C9D974B|nr:GATA transcription factor 15-like [Cucurbita pepo subsp. pepo]